MSLTATASEAVMAELELPLLSWEDIHRGELVAAIDGQHPRDLFDVMELVARGVTTPEIRRAFSVPRKPHGPLHESVQTPKAQG